MDSPSLTWAAMIGGCVLILFFLAGGVLSLVRLWNELKGKPSEPRHSPSIDTKIRLQVDSSEKKIMEALSGAKAEVRDEVNGHAQRFSDEVCRLHGRVSSLQKDIRHDLTNYEKKLDETMCKFLEVAGKQGERVSSVETDLKSHNQRIIEQGQKLDRHLVSSH